MLLGSPYPNPANGPVRFLLQIPVGQTADLFLYDLRGRRLREWRLPGGQQLLEWDGKGAFGRRAAAGLYFLRLQAGQQTVTRKVVFIK